jgi:hypothetical protein
MKPACVLLCSVGWLLASLCGPAAEAPKPHHAAKLLVINDDGFSAFYSGAYRSAQDLQKQVLSYRDTQVAVLEWCILAGSRANYPSQATELIGEGLTEFPRQGDQLAVETFRRLAEEKVDTLEVVARACHEAGLACYASMRMNGDYPASYMGDGVPRMFNSTFWRQHPEFHLRDKQGRDQTKLSYAFAEVRDFKLRLLREAAARDIDGINLDFLRHPPFLGYEEPLVKGFQARFGQDPRQLANDDPRWVQWRCEVMTGFLREARKLLDEAGQTKGRRLGLSARVDWREYRAWGCDIETWLKEGLLDYLVLAQHSLGGYEFSLAPFVAMAKGTGCAILFGEEATVTGHDRTPEEDKLIAGGKMKPPENRTLSLEEYRARAARWYAAGADGLHLFNESRHGVFCALGNPGTNASSTKVSGPPEKAAR